MEMPQIGKHCSESTCQKLDFLPMKCDACDQIFCNDHYFYANHNCPSAYKKDVQVPICPLCNAVVPVPRGQLPDIAVGAHIDNDCQADPAKTRRKAYTNRCSYKGCKVKEIVPVLCNECTLNFCLKHRHPTDHNCEGKAAALRRRVAEAALARKKPKTSPTANGSISGVKSVQGTMSEDEALARALALSMQDNEAMSQEDSDLALARALQKNEARASQPSSRRTDNKSCEVS